MKAILNLLRGILLPVLAAALLILLPVLDAARAATAQCGGIVDVLAQLDAKYGERQLFVGQSAQDTAVVITAHPDGSSWTTVVADSGGRACIGTSGSTGTGRAGGTPGPPGPAGEEG